MKDIRRQLETLEHLISIANADGDYHRVNELLKRIEHLKAHHHTPDVCDPYAPEGNPLPAEDDWE